MQRSMIPRAQVGPFPPPRYPAKPSPSDPRLKHSYSAANPPEQWSLERNPTIGGAGGGKPIRYDPPGIQYSEGQGQREGHRDLGSTRGRGTPRGRGGRPQRYFHTDRVTGTASACCDPNPYGGGGLSSPGPGSPPPPQKRIARGSTNPRLGRSESFVGGQRERGPPKRSQSRRSEIHEPYYRRGSPGGRGGRGGGPRTSTGGLPRARLTNQNGSWESNQGNVEGEQRPTLTAARRSNLNPSPATPADVATRNRFIRTGTVMDSLTPFQGLSLKTGTQQRVFGTSENWVTTTTGDSSSEERKARKRSASNAGIAESGDETRRPVTGANTEELGTRRRKLETTFEGIKENGVPDPKNTENLAKSD